MQQLSDDKQKVLDSFNQYAKEQAGFQFPAATIDIEETPEGKRLEVNMEVSYKGITYHFDAINKDPRHHHLDLIYDHLDSQPLVRQKYADGKTRTREQSRVPNLSERFDTFDQSGKPKMPNPFSGFVVSEAEGNNFLGMCVLGVGSEPHTSEMAFLNRVESWSYQPPAEIVEKFELKPASKPYQGVATTEVCTLLQYAQELKRKGFLVNGNVLEEVVMTARIDNPGSWKAAAKAGMEVKDIDTNSSYGPELRYQLGKKIRL